MCQKVDIPRWLINKKETSIYQVVDIKNINDIEAVFSLFSGEWIFRGQRKAEWPLRHSIDLKTSYASWDGLASIIIDYFKNNHAVSLGKEPMTEFEWTAFVQHHGGITQLLDFTRNPYIALFFAFDLNKNKPGPSDNCVVWAINSCWCKKRAKTISVSELSVLNDDQIFDELSKTSNFKCFVYPLVSNWKTERMERQESVFLMQCDPVYAFEDNLIGEDDLGLSESDSYIKKIIIPDVLSSEVYDSLEKRGLTKEYLLPGDEHFSEMGKIVKQFEDHARKVHEEIKNRNRKSDTMI